MDFGNFSPYASFSLHQCIDYQLGALVFKISLQQESGVGRRGSFTFVLKMQGSLTCLEYFPSQDLGRVRHSDEQQHSGVIPEEAKEHSFQGECARHFGLTELHLVDLVHKIHPGKEEHLRFSH